MPASNDMPDLANRDLVARMGSIALCPGIGSIPFITIHSVFTDILLVLDEYSIIPAQSRATLDL